MVSSAVVTVATVAMSDIDAVPSWITQATNVYNSDAVHIKDLSANEPTRSASSSWISTFASTLTIH